MSGPNLTPTSYVVLGPTSGRRRCRYRLTTAGRAALESVRDRFGAHADADQMATLELGWRWHRVAPDFWAETAASPP